MRLFKPEDYTIDPRSKVTDLAGLALPERPNWLDLRQLVRVLDGNAIVDPRADYLQGHFVPENGDLLRIVAIQDHPMAPGWFGIGLESLEGLRLGGPTGVLFALYNASALPDIRPNFEPAGDA